MNFYKLLNLLEINLGEKIVATYKSSDGHTETKTFSGGDAREKTKEYIKYWLGENPEFSEFGNYAVSHDGIGTVHLQGVKIVDLLASQEWKDKRKFLAQFAEMAKPIMGQVNNDMKSLGGKEVGKDSGIWPDDAHASQCWDWPHGDKFGFRACFKLDERIEFPVVGGKTTMKKLNEWEIGIEAFHFTGWARVRTVIFDESAIIPFQENDYKAIVDETNKLIKKFEAELPQLKKLVGKNEF
jgi:hypothetical protein